MQTSFAKYEGAGNDFILIDNRDGRFTPEPARMAAWCDRHFGIGADGLMTLSIAPGGVPQMHYYNADGSEGEMCGNGARCFALFLHHLGLCRTEARFRAVDGPHEALLKQVDGACGEIELGMTDVTEIRPSGAGWFLNTGVPHYVEFVEAVGTVDLCGRGRALRYDLERFPQGTNVNFVEVLGPDELRMRTYERGVENETLACGTGATAAALVHHFVHRPAACRFAVNLPGGRLSVRFTPCGGMEPDGRYEKIRLTGPARRVFCGTIE